VELLEKGRLQLMDRFRAYFLASVIHFIANHWRDECTKARWRKDEQARNALPRTKLLKDQPSSDIVGDAGYWQYFFQRRNMFEGCGAQFCRKNKSTFVNVRL